ncbi:carboxypeptidase-like regulatory domain-containing protein [Flavobacterium phragmitis]|uniref:Carboxypeptidase regulatory-like domain-containing protein n=1 Tax=Flavobacterium phragmitis TaxID=739143 RepID=A0A1I1XQL8_9FLAO|nr:carboxypeptidase-like regulatory domain-containing protein [Flavobacterium phragmitis]SFE09636.1 hypothetical protein SAMN05216297_12066 [Flavobacterium phragmitis]
MIKRLLLIILLSIPIFASTSMKGAFTIWGRIVDHGFSPIESFSIKVFEHNTLTNQKKIIQDFKVRDDNGEFLIKNLNSGTYLIEVTVENYTRYSIIKTVANKNESVGEIVLQNTW